MDESFDFTFCQVGQVSEDVNLESPKIILSTGNNLLEDGLLDGKNSNQKCILRDDLQVAVRSETSTLKQSAGITRQPENGFKESEFSERKPIVRSKVPFEKGYSQMDWLKLTRTHPDLAGLKGQSNRRRITIEEVKQHKSEGSVWSVLRGRVYNLSPYMKFHPGGVDMLMKAAGKDCTPLFNKYHAWVNADFLLEKCLVGILDGSQ